MNRLLGVVTAYLGNTVMMSIKSTINGIRNVHKLSVNGHRSSEGELSDRNCLQPFTYQMQYVYTLSKAVVYNL